MKTSHLQIVLLYKNVNEDILKELMLSNSGLIASNGLHLESPECSPFIDFIKWIDKETDMPLEKAIVKITSMPAAKFGIEKRGTIKEGFAADLVIMKEYKIKDVFINGQHSLEDESVKEKFSGEVLRR